MVATSESPVDKYIVLKVCVIYLWLIFPFQKICEEVLDKLVFK